MPKLIITLSEQEQMELQEILMDDDKELGLEFIKKVIAPRIPIKGKGGCDSTRKNPFLLPPEDKT
jgi:hypothetical protein